MLVKASNLKKTTYFFIVGIMFFLLLMIVSTSSESVQQRKQSINERQDTIKDLVISQDFYKATVQAYKDFNEQTIKYLGIALGVVSVLVTLLIAWFFFMFRKTLSEIKNDLARDADRLRDVYSRTFDLLNEQARTNLEIFKSRESELKDAIKEGREFHENIRSAMKEIGEDQKVREPVAEKLAEEEVTKVEEKRKEIKEEVEDYKKGLGSFTE